MHILYKNYVAITAAKLLMFCKYLKPSIS